MQQSILLLLFVIPTFVTPMEFNNQWTVQNSYNELLLDEALELIHARNPDYKLFNRSNDRELRDLKFLKNRLSSHKNYTNAQLVQKHAEHLANIFLVSIKHTASINTANDMDRKAFLIDLQRQYILPLSNYPNTNEEKIDALARYFKRTSLDYSNFLQKIPEPLHQSFKTILLSVINNGNEHRITHVILLNKMTESGFFVLFRLQDTSTKIMYGVLYELTQQKKFSWDKKCASMNEYYNKYRNFFIKEYQKYI